MFFVFYYNFMFPIILKVYMRVYGTPQKGNSIFNFNLSLMIYKQKEKSLKYENYV